MTLGTEVNYMYLDLRVRLLVSNIIKQILHHIAYRPFSGGVTSRLATAIFAAMVTPILY